VCLFPPPVSGSREVGLTPTQRRTVLPLVTSKKSRINRRDEAFISRQQLADRWNLSIREIIAREKDGPLKELVYKFSYKVHRYRLSDIVRLEEAARAHPRF
jgi:hypothetical protein